MGISIGLVGLGSFGKCFADMFKAHPLVDRIALCDRDPERMRVFADKAFGDFVYAEGEYFHDVDSKSNLRSVIEHRMASPAGMEWAEKMRRYLAWNVLNAPMHYPTHSTSGPVSVMNAHAEEVTAYGYRNRNGDPYFEDKAYSNETALFKMSNGAAVRICEFRECGGVFAESETFRVMGTRGSYAEGVWRDNFRTAPLTAKPVVETPLTDADMREPLPPEVAQAFKQILQPDADPDDDFKPTGHGGSHPYLVNEFVDAVAHGRTPAISVWDAVRYTAMGVVAHQSAMRDGETLTVPDWGDPIR